jgi:hypothetical protein
MRSPTVHWRDISERDFDPGRCGEVENTGNVPAVITVNLKWDALPGPLFDGGTKTVTLEPGRTREIRSMTKINQNDVDRVQSSPGYRASSDNKFCKVKTSIDNA